MDDKINLKSLKGNWLTNCNTLVRCNPIRIFQYSHYSFSVKRKVLKKYINNIEELKLALKRVPTSNRKSVLDFCIKFDHIKDLLIELYDHNNTWQIAKLLGCSQTTVRKVYGKDGLNISHRYMKCSKIHLKMKPIIESILGHSTITEFFVKKFNYWIDEFSEQHQLCIEIDGRWCHNKKYDDQRDRKLTTLGYKVVRIPAFSSIDEIRYLLRDYSSAG